jgi:FKBP-type peptidyl-prolyl cis-trans isomerase
MKVFYVTMISAILSFNQSCKCDRPTENQPQATQSSEITELEIEDTKIGEGKEAASGKTIAVHYRGTFVDGKEFDSSYNREEPFVFQLGAGQVIKGWDQGIDGMKVGGVRKLKIPAELAYGDRGAGQVIPPNTPLLFEVELLEVQD